MGPQIEEVFKVKIKLKNGWQLELSTTKDDFSISLKDESGRRMEEIRQSGRKLELKKYGLDDYT